MLVLAIQRGICNLIPGLSDNSSVSCAEKRFRKIYCFWGLINNLDEYLRAKMIDRF